MTGIDDPRLATKAVTAVLTLPPAGVGAEEDETASRYSPIVLSRSANMLFGAFPVHTDELGIVGVLDGQIAFTGAFDGLADAHG